MLDDFEVPDYLEQDHRDITKEEDRQYQALRNILIEIETTALKGIKLIRN